MKTTKAILITTIALAFSFNVKAQVVPGSNLNIGENNTLTQIGTTFQSNAIGKGNYLEGAHSLTVGENDTILNVSQASVALGYGNKIKGNGSMAFGNFVKIQSMRSVGIGYFVKITGSMGGMAIGSGLLGSTFQPDLFLENNYDDNLIIGFNSTKPTLTVGPSPNDYPSGDLIYNRTGKVAIGDVPVPEIAAKLHIRSDEGEDAGIFVEPKELASNSFIHFRDEGHGIEVDGEGTMSITAGENKIDLQSNKITLVGKVGINVDNESANYALAVNGGILTNEVFIKNVDAWYDNVFAKDYKLLSLSDLQRYINEFGHLPEIPSETEVLAEGYNMAEMQSILLKKIEELTLYTLKQQEEIEMLKQTIEELKGK